MRGIVPCLVAAVAAVIAVTPAPADSVVLFNDGRFLRVASHEVADDWIRLDVTPDAVLVFPLDRIESVEKDGRIVYDADRGLVAIVADPEEMAKAAERRLWKQLARRSRKAAKRDKPILVALR